MYRVLTSLVICFWCNAVVAQTAAPDPIEAGARYGQARGASQLCPGVKMTKAADSLSAGFQGAEQIAFQAQANLIFGAWRKVKDCVRPLDPNPCRIMIDKSCESAIAEIGPAGTVLPGLLKIEKP
jgi:hypothetical protein